VGKDELGKEDLPKSLTATQPAQECWPTGEEQKTLTRVGGVLPEFREALRNSSEVTSSFYCDEK
jgi:hypothetical protein